MAIQCRICSEILIREDELNEIALDGAPAGARAKRVEVLPDYCPDCFGFTTSGALREHASARRVVAA